MTGSYYEKNFGYPGYQPSYGHQPGSPGMHPNNPGMPLGPGMGPDHPGMQPGPGKGPGHPGMHPPGMRLAEAYVPWQHYSQIFTPQEALQKGTLFPELYRPYHY